jgi:hypothetical protein
MESTDAGITWTEISAPNEWMGGLAYGSSRLVACGYNTDTYEGHIIYSADGINWTTANTDNNYYLRAKNENGNFFVFGYSNDTYLGVVLHSTDGISWTDITPTLPYPVAYFNDIVYDGAKYHLMGMEFADPGNWIVDDFFTVSTATINNASSWGNKGTITSQPPGAQLGGTWGEGAIAYSNGRFAGAVNDVNTGETHVIYSSDGINWTAEPQSESSIIFAALPEGNMFRLLGTGDGKISVNFSSFTLPVHLSSFHVSLVNGQSLLKWQTASEQNSHRFIVQHSTDANHWNDIGTVIAAGESESLRDYQFIHIDPRSGYNYYRLIQTDIDGRQQTSSIKNIVIGEKVNIRLSPNPAHEWVRVELPRQQAATISLFNAGGQQVYRQTHTGSIIRLSLLELPRGIYQVVVEQEGKRYTRQLYKQ